VYFCFGFLKKATLLIIDDKLVSLDIAEVDFECDLKSCKGACCTEGDFGAPLEEDEIELIEGILPQVLPLLTREARKVIRKEGVWAVYDEDEFKGTTLVDNRACVFLSSNDTGYSRCAFEVLYEMGIIGFKKPISCHLYPIRVEENPSKGFFALNYDDWGICSAACTKGKKNRTKLYQFAKEAIVRKYGSEFYTQIEKYAEAYQDALKKRT